MILCPNPKWICITINRLRNAKSTKISKTYYTLSEKNLYLHDPLVSREGDGQVSESAGLKERRESFLRTRQLAMP